jgi:hypothetical protein
VKTEIRKSKLENGKSPEWLAGDFAFVVPDFFKPLIGANWIGVAFRI